MPETQSAPARPAPPVHPKRLLERLLSTDGRDAEEAAYRLVLDSARFADDLPRNAKPWDLDAVGKTLFRTRLEGLLSAIGVRRICELRVTKAPDDVHLQVVVTISSRLSLKIGGKDVRLKGGLTSGGAAKIGCPAADGPFQASVRPPDLEGRRRGVVTIATATVPLRRAAVGDKIPFTIFHDGAAETAYATVEQDPRRQDVSEPTVARPTVARRRPCGSGRRRQSPAASSGRARIGAAGQAANPPPSSRR